MKNTEEMLHTLATLGSPMIRYSLDGQFYVTIYQAEIKEGNFLRGFSEHRSTIAESIKAIYDKLTNEGVVIVLNAYSDKRTEHTFRNGHFVLI
jgi:hypothetical protein